MILNTLNEVESYFECLLDSGRYMIAVDIECEMNLHCYGEHLCLIQIYDQKDKIIIDPLAFDDRKELEEVLKLIFESRNILKIAYDAAGDASLIEKLYGIKFKSVFDLRPAVQLLEYEKQNLSYILNEELSVPMVSKKKFQRYNWMKRPIDFEALKYAISDVVYLFELKEKLMKKIVSRGLLDKYILMNLMVQNRECIEQNPEEIYKKRKGYCKLSNKAKGRYRLMYDLREEFARKINKPPNFLINNIDILSLVDGKNPNLYIFLERRVHCKINKTIRKTFISQLLKILK